MANVVISGDTSGSVTLAAPNVAGSSTITLAAQTGTLNVAGPALSCYLSPSTQTLTNNTNTKITLAAYYDTNSNFSASRFTPTVVGYYQVNLSIAASATTSITYAAPKIYKNGTTFNSVASLPYATTAFQGGCSSLIYMNGTTDYLEAYAIIVGSGTLTVVSAGFDAVLVRGA